MFFELAGGGGHSAVHVPNGTEPSTSTWLISAYVNFILIFKHLGEGSLCAEASDLASASPVFLSEGSLPQMHQPSTEHSLKQHRLRGARAPCSRHRWLGHAREHDRIRRSSWLPRGPSPKQAVGAPERCPLAGTSTAPTRSYLETDSDAQTLGPFLRLHLATRRNLMFIRIFFTPHRFRLMKSWSRGHRGRAGGAGSAARSQPRTPLPHRLCWHLSSRLPHGLAR